MSIVVEAKEVICPSGIRWALQSVHCALCGADDTRQLYEVEKVNFPEKKLKDKIVRCRRCGLVYVNPRFLWPLYYHGTAPPKETDKDKLDGDAEPIYERRILEEHLDIIGRYKAKGRFLDVGCGKGDLLALAQQRGYEVYGLETSKSLAAFVEQRLKIPVFQREIKEAEVPKSRFDIVVMQEVIEHLLDPRETLEHVHPVLKEDGVLFITTPNIDSVEIRLKRERWEMFKPPWHHYFFSARTLKAFLRQTGFDPLEVRLHHRSRSFWKQAVKSILGFIGLPTVLMAVARKRPT